MPLRSEDGCKGSSRALLQIQCWAHPRHTALIDIIKQGLYSVRKFFVFWNWWELIGKMVRDRIVLPYFHFFHGRNLCWDTTCTDTYANTNINSSAVAVSHAAREAKERKCRKYGGLGSCFKFEPVAVERAGVYGESTAVLLSEIGRRITEATGESRETLCLEQMLGLAVQRGILTAVVEKYDVELGTN